MLPTHFPCPCARQRSTGLSGFDALFIGLTLVATGVVRNARLIAADLALAGHNVQLVTALPGGEGAAGGPVGAHRASPGAQTNLFYIASFYHFSTF